MTYAIAFNKHESHKHRDNIFGEHYSNQIADDLDTHSSDSDTDSAILSRRGSGCS